MGWTQEEKSFVTICRRRAAGGSGDCCWLAGHIWPAGLVLQMSLCAVGGHETHQLCPLMAWSGSDSTFCTEYMDSEECHRRISQSVSCPCFCADQTTLRERLLEAWSKDRDRVGALSFPCWHGGDAPLELFSVGSLGLLLGQEGDSCSHSGVLAGLAVAGCLLGLSHGNFFAGCVSTPGGTLLPSENDSEGAISRENS